MKCTKAFYILGADEILLGPFGNVDPNLPLHLLNLSWLFTSQASSCHNRRPLLFLHPTKGMLCMTLWTIAPLENNHSISHSLIDPPSAASRGVKLVSLVGSTLQAWLPRRVMPASRSSRSYSTRQSVPP